MSCSTARFSTLCARPRSSSRVGDATTTRSGPTPHRTRGVRARIRRLAGCATPSGSAGHAGATANLKLPFHLDHSAGADQWRNVDLDGAQLAIVESTEQTSKATRLKETKTGRARTVALPSLVVEELRQHWIKQAQELLQIGIRQSGEAFVYSREDGQPMQPRSRTPATGTFRTATMP